MSDCRFQMIRDGREAIPRSCPTCGIFARVCPHGLPDPLKPAKRGRDDDVLLAAWDEAPNGTLIPLTAEESSRLSALLSRREQAAFWDEMLGPRPTGAEGAD